MDPVSSHTLGAGAAAQAARTMTQGNVYSRVNRAENLALTGSEAGAAPAAAPVAAPAAAAPIPGVTGGQPSPELMARIQANQAARNKATLEQALANRAAALAGGKPALAVPGAYGAKRPTR